MPYPSTVIHQNAWGTAASAKSLAGRAKWWTTSAFQPQSSSWLSPWHNFNLANFEEGDNLVIVTCSHRLSAPKTIHVEHAYTHATNKIPLTRSDLLKRSLSYHLMLRRTKTFRGITVNRRSKPTATTPTFAMQRHAPLLIRFRAQEIETDWKSLVQ